MSGKMNTLYFPGNKIVILIFVILNSITANYCSLDLNHQFLSLDESLRRSYGRTDPFERFNPSKPARYGQQVEMLSGPDGLIVSILPELFQRIIPNKCKKIGQRIAMDNFLLPVKALSILLR